MSTYTATAAALPHAIRARITDAHMTVAQVADAARVPVSTLRRKLAGTSPLRLTQVAVLAQVLHTTPSRLLAAAERAAQQ